MTDNEITACLNAIGLLFDGTVTLTKKIGREEPDVESTMHPFFGLFCCLSGLEELTWQAMHAGGSLKLNLENEEQVRKVFSEMAEMAADGVVKRMRECGKCKKIPAPSQGRDWQPGLPGLWVGAQLHHQRLCYPAGGRASAAGHTPGFEEPWGLRYLPARQGRRL